MDANGLPLRIIVTDGTTADCTQALELIADFRGGALMADKAYDSDEIVEQAEKPGMEVVIPPKSNRKVQRNYDKYLYKLRHLVENAFLHIKQWRGIATRYDKNINSFIAAFKLDACSCGATLFDDSV